jgi:hypothetical protein
MDQILMDEIAERNTSRPLTQASISMGVPTRNNAAVFIGSPYA